MDQPFRKQEKELLRGRVVRLLRFLDMGDDAEATPDAIVAEAISLVVITGIGYCGPDVLRFVGCKILNEQRRAYGFCEICKKDPNPCPPGEPMCAACAQEAARTEKTYLSQEAMDGLDPRRAKKH